LFEFWYLGDLFQADGDPFHELEARAAQAKTNTTFGKLHVHEFWSGSSNILNEASIT